MEKPNSIINSLKRLERVGSETSRATEKLKLAVEMVAREIREMTIGYLPKFKRFTLFQVTLKLFYIIDVYNNENKSILVWDYDLDMDNHNFMDYQLISNGRPISLDVAFAFSKAVSNGLLEKVAVWVEARKAETEKAIEQIAKAGE